MNGGAGAAAAAAIANAIKASGAIVQVDPMTFPKILARGERPLVVMKPGGGFFSRYHYLTPYRGMIFYAKSKDPISLPRDAEIVTAGSIWTPY